MSSPLAPSRSIRPAPRVTPEERRVVDRAAADEMMEAFAALEGRADMDPYLANNPLRRLGYRETGGLRGIDYLPLAPDEAIYFGGGYRLPHLDAEIMAGDELPIFRSIELMDPERAAAFDSSQSEFLIPPRTTAIGPNYFTERVKAHEAGHQGFDVIEDAMLARPELQARFTDENLPRFLDRAREEAVVELGDDLTGTWVQPRGEGRPVGTHESMFHTVQYLPDRGTREFEISDQDFERMQRYEQIIQELAQEELTRRGEPPRAVMQTLGPGNMFYREPEPRGGLLGVLDRIRGN